MKVCCATQAPQRRSCAPKQTCAPRVHRTKVVRVVAFRDTHRAEVLRDTANEFAGLWKKAQTYGCTKDVKHDMAEIVDANVMTTMQAPRQHTKLMGIDALESMLMKQHGMSDMACCNVLLSAVNDDTDTCFMLIGPHPSDLAKMPPAKPGDTSRDKIQYQVLKLDFMLDDTARRITAITHRATMHALAAPPLQHVSHLMPGHKTQMDDVRTHKMAHAWCNAATTGHDPEKMLGPFIAPGFQLWDAYGMMAHQVMKSKGGSCTVPATAATGLPMMMSREDTMRMLSCMQSWGGSGMATETRLMDYATSLEHNAAFAHWICTAAPVASPAHTAAAGGGRDMHTKQDTPKMLGEGMQIALFNSDGRVTDVWMFADAMPHA